jgi:hypothetical protein
MSEISIPNKTIKRDSERCCPVLVCAIVTVLDHNNVLCLRAFLSLHNFELYALAFFQVAIIAIVSEGAVMHENICAFRASNETVAFATSDRTLINMCAVFYHGTWVR